jgi:hypothetical protein
MADALCCDLPAVQVLLDLQQRRIRWRVLLVPRPGSTPLVLFEKRGKGGRLLHRCRGGGGSGPSSSAASSMGKEPGAPLVRGFCLAWGLPTLDLLPPPPLAGGFRFPLPPRPQRGLRRSLPPQAR